MNSGSQSATSLEDTNDVGGPDYKDRDADNDTSHFKNITPSLPSLPSSHSSPLNVSQYRG